MGALTASAATSGYYTYTVSNGKVTITNCDESISGNITIPSTLGGYPVTLIGDSAFRYCYYITSIVIPEGVTRIDEWAFSGCDSLESVKLPTSITYIGNNAFNYSLSNVYISDLTSWCNITFGDYYDVSPFGYGNNLYLNNELVTDLIIPEGVKSIGYNTFESFNSIKSLTIPNSVTDIGYNAFPSSIKDVYITDLASFCKINFQSFDYHSPSNFLYNKNLYLNGELVTDLIIPEGITSVDNFSGYKSLVSVTITIPATVAGITLNGSFYGCSSLTSVTFNGNGSVIYLGEYAFYDCSSLTSITLNNCYISSAMYGSFYGCDSLENIYMTDIAIWCNNFNDYQSPFSNTNIKNLYLNGELVTNLIIPYGITRIPDYIFSDFNSISSVSIPISVTEIGYQAFSSSVTDVYYCGTQEDWENYVYGSYNIEAENMHFGHNYINGVCSNCKELSAEFFEYSYSNGYITITDCDTSVSGDVSIPSVIEDSTVKAIDMYAFDGCDLITSVKIPDSVTYIDYYAFRSCDSLVSVDIPSSVTSLYVSSFDYCNALENINVSASNKNYSSVNGVLFNKAKNTIMLYPAGKKEKEYIIPSGVKIIGAEAFANCKALVNIDIPNGVTKINSEAFWSCNSLASVNIPNSVTSIGSSAFYNCYSLTEITIPDSVKELGQNAFQSCGSLTKVNISKSVTTIAPYVFSGCSSLSSIVIPDGVGSINARAFDYCGSLKTVIIPNSVKGIYEYAFDGCKSLSDIYYCGTEEEWNKISKWEGNTSLSGANIHYHKFENNVCIYCNALSENVFKYEIEDGKATITDCDETISGEVTVPSTLGGYPVTNIGISAFANIGSITKVVLPDTVEKISNFAFATCVSLKEIVIPEGVKEIGTCAFSTCSLLDGVILPDSLEVLGKSAFCACESLTEITIPDGVTSIEESTFSVCSSLTKVIIPDSVTYIADLAFASCRSLTDVKIPYGVKTIGCDAFIGCDSLVSINIPGTVTEIGESAFSHCTALSKVYFCGTEEEWNNITIYEYNTALTSAQRYYHNFVNGVCTLCNVVSEEMFRYAVRNGEATITGINEVWTDDDVIRISGDIVIPSTLGGYPVTCIGSYAFENYGESITSVKLPDTVKTIDYAAFSYCSLLTSINIPDSVTSIGESAFSGCSSLIEINIPNSVTNLGWQMFYGCSSLKSVTLPNTITCINNFTFAYCSSLTSIVIPSSVTSIGDLAFMGCTSLKSITLYSTTSYIGDCAFEECNSLRYVYYYGTKEQWNDLYIVDYTPYGNDALKYATVYYKAWGDADGDGIVNGADLTYITKELFKLLDFELENPGVLDINGDGVFNIIDIVKLKKILLEVK